MCGRYTLTSSHKQLLQELALDEAPELQPRFNLAPMQPAPIVTAAAPKRLSIARWGLLPSWAKDEKVANDFVNARSDKATSTYAPLLRTQRCLVPASAFIEWKNDNGSRLPHLFSPRSGELLTMAGIWNRWRSPAGGTIDTFTMFTTDASAEVAVLHDRMPVFLQTSEERTFWLSDTKQLDDLVKVLRPWLGLDLRPINPRVNNVRNDDAACLSPPATTQLQLF